MLISFATGITLKRYVINGNKRVENYILIISTLVYVIYTIAYLLLFYNNVMDVNNNVYNSKLLTLVLIITGPCFVMVGMRKLRLPCFVAKIGQNTLAFYAFHGLCYVFVDKLFEIVSIPEFGAGTPLRIISVFVICCIMCGVISYIVNRTIPFIVGKSKT